MADGKIVIRCTLKTSVDTNGVSVKARTSQGGASVFTFVIVNGNDSVTHKEACALLMACLNMLEKGKMGLRCYLKAVIEADDLNIICNSGGSLIVNNFKACTTPEGIVRGNNSKISCRARVVCKMHNTRCAGVVLADIYGKVFNHIGHGNV